jgi:hypothetical protein
VARKEAGIWIEPSISGRPGKDFGAGGEAAAHKHTKRILARTGTGRQTELIRRYSRAKLSPSTMGAATIVYFLKIAII